MQTGVETSTGRDEDRNSNVSISSMVATYIVVRTELIEYRQSVLFLMID